ncbi:MAG: hypothetical protein MK180_07690 [Rhodobacteraceae bacterium]|nr:hypothetical protein [Paracoccaceae bacterium]
MKVFDILIVSMGFSPDGKDVVGDVRFMVEDPTGGTRSMTIQCRCTASQRIRPDALLIGEGVRQLRRIPEVRSGQAPLSFARGLKPLQEARAA